MKPLTAMLIIVSSTALYTLLGGVRSSSYIEFLQTLIMVAGLGLAVPVLLSHAGGFTQAARFYSRSTDACWAGTTVRRNS